MPSRTNLNRAEKTCVEYIALLDMELNKAQGVLESRLRSATDAWRQFRIAQVALGKALEGIYDTMTVKNLSQLLEFSTEISTLTLRELLDRQSVTSYRRIFSIASSQKRAITNADIA